MRPRSVLPELPAKSWVWVEEGEAPGQWEQMPWESEPPAYGVSESAWLGLIHTISILK